MVKPGTTVQGMEPKGGRLSRHSGDVKRPVFHGIALASATSLLPVVKVLSTAAPCSQDQHYRFSLTLPQGLVRDEQDIGVGARDYLRDGGHP